MNFSIDQKIFDQCPHYKLGVIIVKNFNNSRRSSPLESLLRGACAQSIKKFANKNLNDERMIQVWNQAYGNFGINPLKYPTDPAGLVDYLRTSGEIPHINTVIDIKHYFSLKHLLPIFAKDLDWLCGDLQLTFTEGGEPFRCIGTINVQRAIEGEAAYLDDGGIVQRYWNHRECERTKVTNRTVNAAFFVDDASKMPMDEFGAILRDLNDALLKYTDGDVEPYMMTNSEQVVDFGVPGRRNVDDGKISQKELLMYEEFVKSKSK